jgi:ABC-type multidrug transport system ATPase subunit
MDGEESQKTEDTNNMEPVLELRDVSKKLGDGRIDHVSFTVEPVKYSFSRPERCGKTTTIKMIVGLLSADSGKF